MRKREKLTIFDYKCVECSTVTYSAEEPVSYLMRGLCCACMTKKLREIEALEEKEMQLMSCEA